ncbi:MAG: chromate efflux transporter [Asticcacaulis sp.]
MSDAPPPVSFGEAVGIWARIGLINFGGPAGQIALMHRVLVEERQWLSEAEYLRALNVCMLLPGPEAQQLATYAGWKLHGVKGGLAAGGLFIGPGALLMLALSIAYVLFGQLTWVQGLFFGVKAVVLAIVIEALLRIAKRALKGKISWTIAAAAFVALFFFAVPFPAVILAAAVAGALFLPARAAETAVKPVGARWWKTLATLVTGLAVWAAPLAVIYVTLGPKHVLWRSGLFFSKLAVVTFGGAYAVLAYTAQEAVARYHWLTTPEMVQGLGLAETTPGPLIMTLQYVGFLAGWRSPTPFSPMVAGVLAAGLTTWVTFVPSFLWIFLVAPYVEALQRAPRLSAALSGITAAVAGVILSLSLWFAVHVLFLTVSDSQIGPLHLPVPDVMSLDIRALIIAAIAAIALLRFHAGLIKVLIAGALAGVALAFIRL